MNKFKVKFTSHNHRIKVYITKVERTTRGPQVIVSRTHPGLLRRLFEMEVPEIFEGIVEIKSIAREAGDRSKISVLHIMKKLIQLVHVLVQKVHVYKQL